MITITPQKTQLELNLERIDEPLRRIENRTKANVEDLNLCLDLFWSLPDEQLLEVLNSHGPVKVQQVFAAHEKYAIAFNELLSDRGITGITANIGAKRQVVVNDQGIFELVPIPEPVVIIEPVIE